METIISHLCQHSISARCLTCNLHETCLSEPSIFQSLRGISFLPGEQNLVQRFRANLVIDGGLPFDEESWTSVSCGDVALVVSAMSVRHVSLAEHLQYHLKTSLISKFLQAATTLNINICSDFWYCLPATFHYIVSRQS